MINKIKELLLKYKSIIMYLIFGVLTTLVNIISYYICSHIIKMSVMSSTIIAWVLAVLFAYLTNRKWVFVSKAKTKKEIINEIISFFSCRIATGIVDWLCMFIFVERLHFNDVIIKVLANILVIILNYIASKFVIFKQKSEEDSQNSTIKILIYSSFAIIAFLFLLQSPLHIWIGSDTNTDSSVFKTIAFMMSKGFTPYLHTFDHKGPLIYIINYIGMFISNYRGVWVIEFISLFTTMIYFYKIARLKCNKLISFIITVLGVTFLSKYFEGGNLTEEYALPFISVSLYYFLDYIINKNIDKKRLIICGLSCGAVFMLRPNMISTWIVFCIYIFIKTIIDKDTKKLKDFIIYFLIGFLVSIIPFIIWLASKGALKAFIDEYFLFNKMYATGGLKKKIIETYKLIFLFVNNPLSLISFVTIVYFIKDKKEYILYLVYMIITMIFICMGGNEYLHYMMIFVPVIIFPFACLFNYLENCDKKNNVFSFLLVLYLLINIMFPYWIPVFRSLPKRYIHRNSYKISKNVSDITDYIKVKTNEDDKISVYGNSDIFYIISKRMHATKYSYQFPIGDINKEILDDYYKELNAELPKIIIVQDEDDRINEFLDSHKYHFIFEKKVHETKIYKVYELN